MSIRSIFCNSKSYFQKLAICSSSLILTASLVTFGLPKISVKAGAGPEYMIVTHPNGINIRDKNCKIIGQATYGEPLNRASDNPINLTCNIGGKNVNMLNYGNPFGNAGINTQLKDMYVVSKFVQEVKSGNGGTYTNQDKVRLNNPGGVNLRDDKYQRVMTLPNGTFSEQIPAGYSGGSSNICKAGGEFYYMTSFVYKGQIYQVAEVLTKFE